MTDRLDPSPARYELGAKGHGTSVLQLDLLGVWRLQAKRPTASEVFQQITGHTGAKTIVIGADSLSSWDSGLLTFLINLRRRCDTAGITTDASGLPDGVQSLLRLASTSSEEQGRQPVALADSFLARIGKETKGMASDASAMLDFIGEATLALVRLSTGRARFRRSDLMLIIQEVGAQALPIVSLISFLVGGILAFLGAIQLVQFGASIFVADLVGIAMAREMGAMMTGIIMAGRTGAAFAAQLGTMQVNEELDALSTLGISPMEFLVLPRMLALILMLPLLCLYADLMGILGGALVGVSMLDLSIAAYFEETVNSVGLHHFAGGLVKSAVYGVVIALAGCMRGMQCGRSSAAVGLATTSAVVTAIVLIVLSMATLTVIYYALGI